MPKPLLILDRTFTFKLAWKNVFHSTDQFFIFHDKRYTPHFHHSNLQYIAMDVGRWFFEFICDFGIRGAMGVQDYGWRLVQA